MTDAPVAVDNLTTPSMAPAPAVDSSVKPLAAAVAADVPASAPANWPENWRDKFAAGDEKLMTRLGRFNSPEDVWKSYRALEQKQSSGELKKSLPDNPTPEDLKAYRQDNGIPESFKDYKVNPGDGIVIGESDQPLVDKFLEKMHGKNASEGHVNAALSAYYELIQDQEAAQVEGDKSYRKESEDALRAEWGSEYRANVNSLETLFTDAPDGLKDRLYGARFPDGRLLGDDADALRWMTKIVREINPVATVVPSGTNQMQSLTTEMSALEAKQGTKSYTAEDRARYIALTEVSEKLKARR